MKLDIFQFNVMKQHKWLLNGTAYNNKAYIQSWMEKQFHLTQKCNIGFVSGQSILYMKQSIEVVAQASYSASQTIGAYLCFKFPQLAPPGCPEIEVKDHDEVFPSDSLSSSHYFQPWCDYITKIHLDHTLGQVIKYSSTVFYICYVPADFYNHVKQLNHQSLIQDTLKSFLQFPGIKQIKQLLPSSPNKKIGIMNFSASQLKKDKFRPKINLISLYTGIWYQNGDQWKIYNILKNQIPTVEEFNQLDVIFLTGSSLSANDNVPEVKKLFEKLNGVMRKNLKIKVVGLCFGHQGLGRYNKGKVQKHPLLNGIQKIKLFPEAKEYSIFSDLPEELLLAQYHSDSINQIPEGFKILASSSDCQTQFMISNNGQCISFQCHPEYTIQYNQAFANRVIAYEKGALFHDFGKIANEEYSSQQSMKSHKNSIQKLRLAIRKFIDM